MLLYIYKSLARSLGLGAMDVTKAMQAQEGLQLHVLPESLVTSRALAAVERKILHGRQPGT